MAYTFSIVNRPVEFPGTEEQKAANARTHRFNYMESDARCGECDCRPCGVVAGYPCGTEPPREWVEVPL